MLHLLSHSSWKSKIISNLKLLTPIVSSGSIMIVLIYSLISTVSQDLRPPRPRAGGGGEGPGCRRVHAHHLTRAFHDGTSICIIIRTLGLMKCWWRTLAGVTLLSPTSERHARSCTTSLPHSHHHRPKPLIVVTTCLHLQDTVSSPPNDKWQWLPDRRPLPCVNCAQLAPQIKRVEGEKGLKPGVIV